MSLEAEQPQRKTPLHLPPLPIASLSAGLRRKESALTVQPWVALALTLDGRDKLTKMMQYLSRLLAFVLTSHPTHSKRFAGLKVSLTNSRKAFRMGRTFIELYRLQGLGVMQALMTCLEQQQKSATRAGLTAITTTATATATTTNQPVTFYQSLRVCTVRMYQPILSRLASSLFVDSTGKEVAASASSSFLMVLASAVKLIGLAGFWAADNANFLAMSGLFDNYTLSNEERIRRRDRIQSKTAVLANRSYFLGAVGGLFVTFRSYYSFKHQQMRQLQEAVAAGDKEANKLLEQAKEKQFVLFTALVKSVCDILVFSNNPGLDFWTTYRGRKMNEGFHCLCGLTSAATVLYSNYPDAKK
jgi:hypothetical protein